MLGILSLTPDLKINHWPSWLEEYTGRPAAEVQGKLLFEAFPNLETRGLKAAFEYVVENETPLLLSHALHNYIFPPARGEPIPQSGWLLPIHQEGQLSNIILTLEDVRQRSELEAELQRRVDHIEALLSIDRLMLRGNTGEILSRLVESAARLFNAPQAEIYILEEDRLVLTTSHNTSGYENTTLVIDLGEGIVGQVARSGEAVRVLDVRAHPDYVPGAPNVVAEMAAPIRAGDHLFGVLNVESDTADEFARPDALHILNSLADEAAIALRSALARQQERRRARDLGLLRQLSLRLTEAGNLQTIYRIGVEYALRLLNASAAFIYTYDPKSDTADLDGRSAGPTNNTGLNYAAGPGIPGLNEQSFRPPRPGGLTHTTARTRKSIIVNDPLNSPFYGPEQMGRDDFQAIAAFPIQRGKHLFGVLTVSFTYPKTFQEEQEEVLNLLVEQLAAHVENTRLHAQTRRNLSRMTALRKIETTITSSMNLNLIFHELLGHAISQIKADAGAILLLDPITLTLHHGASRGFRSAEIHSTQTRLSDDHAGRAILERRRVHISNLPLLEATLSRTWLVAREGFVSGLAFPLIAKGRTIGTLELYARHTLDVDAETIDFLETLTRQAAVAVDHIRLFEQLEQSNLELTASYGAVIRSWVSTLEARGFEPPGHIDRVVSLSTQLAEALGVDEEQMLHLQRGAQLHDIGKLRLPDAVILKAGRLNAAEWEAVRRHPTHAAEMIETIHYLRPAAAIPLYHHERWDGSGYPRGLKGEQIPLEARIFAVVDVWDSMCAEQPYRPAHPSDEVLQFIAEQSGQLFDPRVVETFLPLVTGE